MSPGDPSSSHLAAFLDAQSAARVERGFLEGVATHGRFDVTAEDFRVAVEERARRHGLAQGAEPDRERVGAYVRDAELRDVYLAVACEIGDERAWETLSRSVRPRLEGFALHRGASAAEAQAVAQDVLGDLALPPPRGAARTLLGTFDGTGSLFAWLAIVLLRRLAARARGRKVASLEAARSEEADVASSPAAVGQAVGPVERAEGRETEGRFRSALAAAWEHLSGQERCAIVWKHRDGLTQRRIGDLLRVGEARVSRIVSGAVAKLASGVRTALDGDGAGPPGAALWDGLAAAVSDHWTSVNVETPHTSGEAPRGAAPGGVVPGSASPQRRDP